MLNQTFVVIVNKYSEIARENTNGLAISIILPTQKKKNMSLTQKFSKLSILEFICTKVFMMHCTFIYTVNTLHPAVYELPYSFQVKPFFALIAVCLNLWKIDNLSRHP